MAIDYDSAALPEGVAGSLVRDELAVPPPGAGTPGRAAVVRFFASVFLSLYGDWLSTVALVVLLFELTGSPAGPAGYLLARVAPRLLGPAIGGPLADRLSPRRVMVVTFLLQGFFTASFVASHQAHLLWALYVAIACAQFLGALARPSQGALLPALVPKDQLRQANALYGMFFSTSIFVGPAVGAGILLRTGPDLLFILDAGTFVVGAILAATLPEARAAGRSLEDTAPMQRARWSVLVGLRDPVVRLVAVVNLSMGLTITVAQAFLVVAAHERFGSDDAVGILYASVGIGGTLGGLLALRWRPPQRRMFLILYSAAVAQVVAFALFAATSNRYLDLLLLALNSVASAGVDVWGITEIQRRAPAGYMGRFNAIPWASQYAGMLVGALWALGTTAIFHWDLALEMACLAMVVVMTATGMSLRGNTSADTDEP